MAVTVTDFYPSCLRNWVNDLVGSRYFCEPISQAHFNGDSCVKYRTSADGKCLVLTFGSDHFCIPGERVPSFLEAVSGSEDAASLLGREIGVYRNHQRIVAVAVERK